MAQDKTPRRAAFWYLAEMIDTPELAECRMKYLAERGSDPQLDFRHFAANYLGRPYPWLPELFQELGRRGYKTRTLPLKNAAGITISSDISGDLLQSTAFMVETEIKEEDLEAVKSTGFSVSR